MDSQDAEDLGFIVILSAESGAILSRNAARYVMNESTSRYEEEGLTTTSTSPST